MKASFSRGCRVQSIHVALCLLPALILGTLPGWNSKVFAQGASEHRKVLVRVQPEYPEVLKNGRFEGQVRLEATVLENGNVSKVEIKGGSPMFAQFAAKAVAKWKYVPGPTRTTEEVVFNFNSGTN